jgi:hypothetical protein
MDNLTKLCHKCLKVFTIITLEKSIKGSWQHEKIVETHQISSNDGYIKKDVHCAMIYGYHIHLNICKLGLTI